MTSARTCVVVGAGGHAAVLIDCLRRLGSPQPRCLTDVDPKRWNTTWLGLPIMGGDDMLAELQRSGINGFVVGVGRTGGADIRRSLFAKALAAGLRPVSVIDPNATLAESATVMPGAQILNRADVNVGASIGTNAVVNTAAVVEHDCIVGDHAFVASGAILGGGVKVGEGALIGLGAIVLPGIEIGADAVIGAGAVARQSVPPGATMVGVPARRIERCAYL